MDKEDAKKVFKFKKEGKVSFQRILSIVDFMKDIEHITPNLKRKFGGKLVKTILSKFEE